MENNFIKLPLMILGNQKLTLTEKVLISMILSFQSNNLTCTKSNKTLAQELSISEISLKRLIAKLNKTNWFTSESTSKHNEFGKWTNSKEMKINLDELINYLETEDMKTTHLKEQNKVEAQEINNIQPIQEPQTEEKVAEIASNEVIEEQIKPIDVRTEEQKKEDELLNSLIIKEEVKNDKTFEITTNFNTFQVPIEFKETYELAKTYALHNKNIMEVKNEYRLASLLEDIREKFEQNNEINKLIK